LIGPPMVNTDCGWMVGNPELIKPPTHRD
jgi:hypothetical protein